VQGNGKIVLGADSNYRDAAARFNPNGRLDTTFASQGILNRIVLSGETSFCTKLALDGDDRLILAGGSWFGASSPTFFHMRRYSQNGVFDSSFGFAGDVSVNMGDYAFVDDVVVQPDRKIVLVGHAQSGSIRSFGIVRCNANGTLDPAFGTGGSVITHFGREFESANGVALQPDGKIIVAGYSQNDSDDSQFALARYTPNGTLDPAFNGTGKAIAHFGPDTEAFTVALQRDGKIVVGGWVNLQMALARFNSNGTVDTSFGTNGLVTHREGNWDSWQKIIVQPDQKIVAFGHSAGSPWLVVTRYDTNGVPDPAFGLPPGPFRVGTALIPMGTKMSEANDITLQPDGKILIAATAYETNSSYSDVALARLENDAATPPSLTCPSPVTVNCGESATLTASVSDPSGSPLTVVWNVNGAPAQTNSLPGTGVATNFVVSFTGAFPMGTNDVMLTVTDPLTNSDSCSTSVAVIDSAPPVIASAIAGPAVLWPPNHKLIEVNVSATVTDNCDDSATWKIVQVSSNEPSNGPDPDWIITSDNTVLLRAERSGATDRIYSVTIQATDSSGNLSAPDTLPVVVPASGRGLR
jgi:uncharacterized delta-60 repeat protein